MVNPGRKISAEPCFLASGEGENVTHDTFRREALVGMTPDVVMLMLVSGLKQFSE